MLAVRLSIRLEKKKYTNRHLKPERRKNGRSERHDGKSVSFAA